MRLIATQADMYGPSMGGTVATSELHLPGAMTSAAGTGATGQAIPVTQLFTNLRASIFGQPITWLIGLVLFLVAYKLIEEHRGGREAFEEIKIGGNNIVKVTFMVLLGFFFLRFILTRYEIPGLSPFVHFATGGSTAS
jgi:uncharacterized membrane protein